MQLPLVFGHWPDSFKVRPGRDLLEVDGVKPNSEKDVTDGADAFYAIQG